MDARDPICERLGELAASAAPDAHGPPDARQWVAIDARRDRRPGRGIRRLWPALALSAAAAGLVAFVVARRPLDYRVRGCAEILDGASCAAGQGAVHFSDGTQVVLDPQTQIHIEPLAFGRGAAIALDDGKADLAVVHRERARWTVNAGPYRVDVTGTRFRVAWSKAKQTVSVSVTEGEVHVSGGSLRHMAVLRAGQSLHAGGVAEVAPQARARETSTVTRTPEDVPKKSGSPASVGLFPHSVAKRGDPSTRTANARPRLAPTRLAQSETPLQPLQPPSPLVPAAIEHLGEPGHDLWTAPAARPVTPAPLSVAFTPEGNMTGAMTGATWLVRGDGTKLSAPFAVRERSVRLRPQAEGLCVSGTVAGLRCVNEDTPKARCNWDTNWGVAIGFGTRNDEEAWGPVAPKRIALEFHGRQASYRLNAHRKADPHEKTYCIENYRSGQAVTASMFKSRCWEDSGETLPGFADVDLFNLQFSSGMEYVAFHYCISAIRVER
jgi:hypothetical protein